MFMPIFSRIKILQVLLLLLMQQVAVAQVITTGKEKPIVSFNRIVDGFPLASENQTASIYVASEEEPGVVRATNDLREDIYRVNGHRPALTNTLNAEHLILVGTLGKNKLIDQLVQSGKLDVKTIQNTWENYLIQVIKNPFPGVKDVLVVVGSDKRGTIYGLYTISSAIGVSPWYWWADAPIQQQKAIYIYPGKFSQGSPAVKYRGIFLNDEAPALSGWAQAKYGGFNSKFYAQVFELILRLKGNYLWPAMWGNAFYADDPENARLANEYGVVIGTSHHEPMMRAHDEWRRFGNGKWNYSDNAAALGKFWKEGITRMGSNESIVTVGMRGDGDEPMSQESNISLLEKIVADQRNTIESVTGKAAAKTPQVWALYKEVQDYYDKGMRVPDDVTLLLCDDNWGNLRKLPALDAAPRTGGYGIYYHFDYVGGPRNYKWINTNPISKTWEQMQLAYAYKARQIWIVNVGDLKPLEFPISFFLDYAWNPDKIKEDDLQTYTSNWAAQQFGAKYGKEIGSMLSSYTKYLGRRKPELLDEHTYSLQAFSEFERVTADLSTLEKQAEALNKQLDRASRDAYFQLVLHPIKAAANLYQLYLAAAKNQQYSKEGRASTNQEAEKVKVFFQKDAALSKYYNDTLAKGKWAHLMDQTHIGYTGWQQPDSNKMPELRYINPMATAQMGIALLGTGKELPEFNRYSNRQQYLDIYNRGLGSFTYSITTPVNWIKVSRPQALVETDSRVFLTIDWSIAPKQDTQTYVLVKANGKVEKIFVKLKAFPSDIHGFIPDNNVISIEAAHYTAKKNTGSADWRIIPDYGRTGDAVHPFPITVKARKPGTMESPVLEYLVNLNAAGEYNVAAYLAPSLNFSNNKELRYAVSIDNEAPQVVNINADTREVTWNKRVADNINIQTTKHPLLAAGAHTLKFWMVDPGIVLEKLVVSPTAYQEQTYLGPPESAYVK
jgi:hypothetical protein